MGSFFRTFSCDIIARLTEDSVLDKLWSSSIITDEERTTIGDLASHENRRTLVHIMQTKNPSVVPNFIHILKTSVAGQDDLLKKMSCFKPEFSHSEEIWFDVLSPVFNFTGRKTELNQLHKLISTKTKSGGSFSMLSALTGLGGVGKTEIARKYASDNYMYFHGNVVWINAENTDSMLDSFSRLAEKLNLPYQQTIQGNPISNEILVESVYTWFGSTKSLFIFDNVEALKGLNGIDKFLPKVIKPGTSKPFILITSRKSDLVPTNRQLNIDVLEVNEAIELVMKSLPNSNKSEVCQLVGKLQRLPIALQQAIAYMGKKYVPSQGSILKYLAEYENNSKIVLSDLKFIDMNMNDYSTATLLTWKVTLDKIQKEKQCGELAIQLINLMAFLNPDHITLEFLANVVNEFKQRRRTTFLRLIESRILKRESSTCPINLESVTECCMLLRSYSMIILTDLAVVQIHRLVQDVIRIDIVADKRKLKKITSSIVRVINGKLQSGTCGLVEKECMSHGLTILQFYLTQDRLMSKVPTFPSKLCWYLNLYGNYEESLEIAENTLSKFKVLFGENYGHSLEIGERIASSLYHKREYVDSMCVYEELGRVVRIKLGESHPLTFTIFSNMALVYMAQGKYQQALEMYNRLIPLMSAAGNGEESLNVLTSLHNKALALSRLEMSERALGIWEDVYKRRVAILGAEHPNTITTLYCIALELKRKGDLDSALKIFKNVVVGFSNILGTDHPDTIKCKKLVCSTMTSLVITDSRRASSADSSCLSHLGTDYLELLETTQLNTNITKPTTILMKGPSKATWTKSLPKFGPSSESNSFSELDPISKSSTLSRISNSSSSMSGLLTGSPRLLLNTSSSSSEEKNQIGESSEFFSFPPHREGTSSLPRTRKKPESLNVPLSRRFSDIVSTSTSIIPENKLILPLTGRLRLESSSNVPISTPEDSEVATPTSPRHANLLVSSDSTSEAEIANLQSELDRLLEELHLHLID